MNQHYTYINAPARPVSLNGSAGYWTNHDRVVITIDEIANNRWYDNLSGTLSVELWAMAHPYDGGAFSGYPVAGTRIGEISGQHCLRNCHYDLPFTEPPAGNWNLVLMLREWENGAYITRDFMNFDLAFVAKTRAAAPQVNTLEGGKVIEVRFGNESHVAPTTEQSAAEPQNTDAELTVGVPTKSAAKPTRKTARSSASAKKPSAKQKKSAASAEVRPVSLNSATIEQIQALNGVSKKLSQAIYDARPFESLDQVLKVKGLGKKTFEKFKSDVTL